MTRSKKKNKTRRVKKRAEWNTMQHILSDLLMNETCTYDLHQAYAPLPTKLMGRRSVV